MWTKDDLKFMRQAHDLARSAQGRTSPDPLVGAVIVKSGRIISVGYHGEVTTPHAEGWAIDKAEERVKGATIYVNLEPCSHFGNNPPCVDLIIKSGIKEVVVSMKDPNPLVNGQGFRKLKRAGVKVRVGLLAAEAKKLNEVFVKYITTGLPFVALKSAMTLDGKIATRTGASRWVAGKESLKFAHELRNLYDAILVGIGNVLIDDPKLTTRLVKKIKNPIRIVLDTHGRTPLKAEVLKTDEARTIIAVGKSVPKSKIAAFEKKGAQVLVCPAAKGKINLTALLKKLVEMNITSVLVEGGGEINASFLEAGLVDKAHFIIAPKIFGGRSAKTGVEGEGVSFPAQAKWLKEISQQRLGEDFLISGYF